MANEINLLVGQKKAIFADVLRPLKIGTIIFLIAYCLVSLTIISYFAFLDIESKKINKEIEAKKNLITRLRKVESLVLMNSQRLSALSRLLLQKKTDMPATLEKIKTLAGNDVSLTEVKIEADGSLNFGAAASGGKFFVDFYNRLLREKDFPEMSLTSVSRDGEGGYRWKLMVKLW